jgi:hypothetical protein
MATSSLIRRESSPRLITASFSAAPAEITSPWRKVLDVQQRALAELVSAAHDAGTAFKESAELTR